MRRIASILRALAYASARSSDPPPPVTSLYLRQIHALDSHKLAAAAGPQADTVRFVEYIQRNMALNEFRTGLKLSVAAAAAYVRTELATALRKAPYQANLLVGGVDEDGPSLFFMDYLASCELGAMKCATTYKLPACEFM